MKAYLVLEDKTVLEGISVGAPGTVISEIVFNTSMTGYLEVFTDPSYAGQSVVMTYPLIGNYGICYQDMESCRPWIQALIVRELSHIPSNFRSGGSIQHFLKSHNIPGISHIDTRSLTKQLRENGTMKGMITTEPLGDLDLLVSQIKSCQMPDPVKQTTCKKSYTLPGSGRKIGLIDFGAKKNISTMLTKRNCKVTVYPAMTKAETILSSAPDGIVLSNGPGDPKDCSEIIKEIRKLYDSGIPIFAVCLGHQLMALATGGDTRKMKYGHRGGNHPVKDLETGKIYMSSQNHGYVVKTESIRKEVAIPAFFNVNDGSLEGLRYQSRPVLTVQFHPESSPGPRDTKYLFDRFLQMIEEEKKCQKIHR